MAAKRGRPRKAMPQNIRVRVSLTSAQEFMLRHKAAQAGVTVPECFRQLALKGYVDCKWTAEERQMLKQMIGMSVDFHRLAVFAKKEQAEFAEQLFTSYRDQIDKVISIVRDGR